MNIQYKEIKLLKEELEALESELKETKASLRNAKSGCPMSYNEGFKAGYEEARIRILQSIRAYERAKKGK